MVPCKLLNELYSWRGNTFMNVPGTYLILSTSYLIGGGSLIALMVFLYAGALNIVVLDLGEERMLLLDAGLSFLFFIQHSLMIRRSFRQSMARYIPEEYCSAFYAIASGIALLVVVVFWQGSDRIFVTFHGISRWFFHLVLLVSIAGMFWGTQALKYFDPFGIRQIIRRLHGRTPGHIPLAVRGPYRWVRHPLYFFVIVIIWSSPDVTADRLLFNVLWTMWIIVATFLEERDLVAQFGGAYIEYQKRVPMIFPCKRPLKNGHSL